MVSVGSDVDEPKGIDLNLVIGQTDELFDSNVLSFSGQALSQSATIYHSAVKTRPSASMCS